MTNYYTKHAEKLTQQYNQTTFDAVHKSWLHLLPAQPGLACDIGAGLLRAKPNPHWKKTAATTSNPPPGTHWPSSRAKKSAPASTTTT